MRQEDIYKPIAKDNIDEVLDAVRDNKYRYVLAPFNPDDLQWSKQALLNLKFRLFNDDVIVLARVDPYNISRAQLEEWIVTAEIHKISGYWVPNPMRGEIANNLRWAGRRWNERQYIVGPGQSTTDPNVWPFDFQAVL